MRRLRQQFPDHLTVIGVHSAKFTAEKDSASLRQAVMRLGIDHPVVNDGGFEIWQQYAVKAWPTLILIDPTGRIVDTRAGEVTAAELAPLVEALIDRHQVVGVESSHRTESSGEPDRALSFPSKVIAASDEMVFIADTGHHRVLEARFDNDGSTLRVGRIFGSGQAGLVDGPMGEARFDSPHGLAVTDSSLWVADTENHAIRLVDLAGGDVSTVAGTGRKGRGGIMSGVDPRQVDLRSPWDLLAIEDILFIAMAGSHQLWMLLDQKGERVLARFAGNGREALVDGPRGDASFNQPSGLAFGMGHLFVADSEASAIRALPLTGEESTLTVKTLIGKGLFSFGDVDGEGPEVRLQHPTGLAFADDQVLVADTYNHKIKALDPTTGMVTTVAGDGAAGHVDGPGAAARFFEPEGLGVSSSRLLVADTNNHQVRSIDLALGTVQTIELLGS